MDHFFTYMLIDPRNSLPFYVGKGQRRRIEHHFREARTTTKNTPKLQKIRKIESLGLSVIVRKVEDNVSDADAQDFEKLIIAEARAKGIQLCNLTDGGDGSAGYKHLPESLEKIRASQVGKIVSEETKLKLSKHFSENNPMHRPDVIAKTTGENHWAYGKPPKNKGVPMPEEQKKKLSEATKGEKHHFYGKKCSDERRAAIAYATKGVKKSTTVNMRKPKRKEQCPHCGLLASGGNLKRWHLDNCKEKPIAC